MKQNSVQRIKTLLIGASCIGIPAHLDALPQQRQHL